MMFIASLVLLIKPNKFVSHNNKKKLFKKSIGQKCVN